MAKGREFTIKIENVVAFTALNINISLNKLLSSVENTEYKPKQFPGLVYRHTNPKSAALIFSSGKIVCTGTKSIEMAKQAMKKVVKKLKESGVSVPSKYPIHVENIVASSKIEAELHLEDIAFSLDNAEYEPEQFPGLVYRIKDPRVAFLLFSSGRIICTGAQNIKSVHRALYKFKEDLEGIGVKVIPEKDKGSVTVPATDT